MLRLRHRRALTAQSGQATVEFALVLPIVVVALLCVIQVGLVVRDSLVVQDVAREAARAAAIEPTSTTAGRVVVGANGGLDPERLSVTLGGGDASGQLVTATVVYRSPTLVPIVGPLIGDVPLKAAVTMRVE